MFCSFFVLQRWWSRRESLSRGLRARSGYALTVHRTVIHSVPVRFPSFHQKQQGTPASGCPLLFGGADGNRTRVQKPVDMTFSADSHSFEISPRGAPGDRLSGRVALFSMTDARAKYRCMFTTHLTHGRSRSPLRRYGRHENAATRLTPLQQLCCCRLLFKSDGFTGSSCPLRLSYRKVPVETITAPNGGKSDLFLPYYTRIRRNCQERRLSQLRFFALFFVLCAPLCPKNKRGAFFGRGRSIPLRFPRIARSFSHPNDALFPPPYLYENGGRRGHVLFPFANNRLRQKYTKTVLFCQEEFTKNHCKNCPIFL